MKQELTKSEKATYTECQRRIKDGLQTCFEVGAALRQVREEKLYRDDFDTFEDFCQQLFQIGRSYAHRLIEAHEVKDSLPANLEKHITNEAQARALGEAEEKERPKIIQHLVKSKTPITADAIEKTIENTNETAKPMLPIGNTSKSQPEPKDAVELDEVKQEIPDALIPIWRRRDEIQKLLSACSLIKSALRSACNEQDSLWVELTDMQQTQRDIANIWTQLKLAMPCAVCPTCKGKEAKCEDCKNCSGRGMVSQFRWKQTSA